MIESSKRGFFNKSKKDPNEDAVKADEEKLKKMQDEAAKAQDEIP